MSDPFKLEGPRPAVVANSGGKTSGYNLRLHLDANGGALPGQHFPMEVPPMPAHVNLS